MDIHLLLPDLDFGLCDQGGDITQIRRLSNASGKLDWPDNGPFMMRVRLRKKKLDIVWVDGIRTLSPGNGNSLLLSAYALGVLASFLQGRGALSPLDFGPDCVPTQPYVWFNCTTWLEGAIDASSTGKYEHNYWGDIEKWEFNREVVMGGPSVFMVPNDSFRNLYCTGEVAKAIDQSDLIGFDVPLLWSSETGGKEHPLPPFSDMYCPSKEVARQRREAKLAKRKIALKALAMRA